MRSRAEVAGAENPAAVEAIGRASVLDTADDEGVEGSDITPGADVAVDDDPAGSSLTRARSRLRALARQAEKLAGPQHDAKLTLLTAQVKDLLAQGLDPIIFCKFIHTADYVAEHLRDALGKNTAVASVTGTLPPSERVQRIDELTAEPRRHVLVATDCLSEGVNLQEHFQAVVHYDLAWNPTRHEQREGRVDRFGPVSYTHLDVYKRQSRSPPIGTTARRPWFVPRLQAPLRPPTSWRTAGGPSSDGRQTP